MALCGIRWGQAAFRVGVAGVLIGCGLTGCGKPSGGAAEGDKESAPAAQTGPDAQAGAPYAHLCQSFADATVAEPPDGQILPDSTLTRKSVGKLYEEAVRTWDQVKFVTADGKPIAYSATIDTEIGSIEMNLLPETAPNHVRSFVVLARIGYYDGLVFERTIHDQSDAVPDSKLELIEGGCPMGTGNPGFGSIGYWLKPEFSEAVKHEEGTVGACLGEANDTASCRFYVTASRAPVMDGYRTIFGKVTRGLDVVRRISTQPVLNAPEFPDGSRPEHPIMIRKVTIHTKVMDKQTVKHDNGK